MKGIATQNHAQSCCRHIMRWEGMLLLLAFLLAATPVYSQESDQPTVISGVLEFPWDKVATRANVTNDGQNYLEFGVENPDDRPTIDIRYRIFLLLGEPVATYEA